jgi:hypothetical protein
MRHPTPSGHVTGVLFSHRIQPGIDFESVQPRPLSLDVMKLNKGLCQFAQISINRLVTPINGGTPSRNGRTLTIRRPLTAGQYHAQTEHHQ